MGVAGPPGGGRPPAVWDRYRVTADRNEFTRELITELRRTLPPAQQDELTKVLQEAAQASVKRFIEMDAMVRALKVLHRPGTGERAGFCSECGNVVPCQTARFIEPFV